MNENEFEIILGNDEKVIKTFKPNKHRFLTINIIFTMIFVFILAAVMLSVGIIIACNPSTSEDVAGGSVIAGIGGLVLIGLVIGVISSFIQYRKTIYAITNKRVIIRSGFIGVDYKSLDLDSIGAVSVRVDFLDKLIKPINTGTIDFGSMSMPMGAGTSGQGGNQYFSFKHIDHPYDIYKEVKEYIAKAKGDTK